MQTILPALLAVAAALPGAAAAAELWCMPETICGFSGGCHATADTEASVRLHDFDGAAPMLRSHAEDVAMTRTHDGAEIQWQGTTDTGATEILAWRPGDGAFTHILRRADGSARKATGRCEVQ